MAEMKTVDMKQKRAYEVYDALCTALDHFNWTYKREDDKLTLRFGVRGDDIPMQFIIRIDADRQLIRLLSPQPYSFPSHMITTGAAVTSQINYLLADGSFDYDVTDGSICFRLTSSFRDSLVSEELLQYLVNLSCNTIDLYNDKLDAIAKGELDADEFMKTL